MCELEIPSRFCRAGDGEERWGPPNAEPLTPWARERSCPRAGTWCSAATTERELLSDGQGEIKLLDHILTILNFSHILFCSLLCLLEPGVRWYLIKCECIYLVT